MIPMINNGSSTPTGSVFVGETVDYSCDVGFQINGMAIVICLMTGTSSMLSPERPTCVQSKFCMH